MSKYPDMLYELAVSARKPRWWAEQLRREAREFERKASQFESIVQPGIDVDHINANSGFFGDLPIESCRLFLSTNSPQSIPNATDTVIDWDPKGGGVGSAPQEFGVPYDETNNAIDLTNLGNDSKYMIWYHLEWASSAAGIRMTNLWDPVLSSAIVRLHYDDPPSDGSDMPVHGMYWWGVAGWSPDIHTIAVYQNSGGALDINFARFGVFRIR